MQVFRMNIYHSENLVPVPNRDGVVMNAPPQKLGGWPTRSKGIRRTIRSRSLMTQLPTAEDWAVSAVRSTAVHQIRAFSEVHASANSGQCHLKDNFSMAKVVAAFASHFN